MPKFGTGIHNNLVRLIPEVPLKDPVHALVEWPGGVVAGPVVVVAVGVGEEVPGEGLEHALLLPRLRLRLLPQRAEVVAQGAELDLRVELGTEIRY